MLTFLNERELITTFSMKEKSAVTEKLQNSQIEYRIKTITRVGSQRGNVGTYGFDAEKDYQYIIYVNKKDYDEASYYLNSLL